MSMKTPKITVFYDDEEQEFVHLSCYRSDIFNMDLTYNKQMGNDHVLKVKVETGKKVLAIFKFGQKTIRLIDYNPTFDGFYDSTTRRTKQFKLGDFDVIRQLVQNDQEQVNKLIDQIPVLSIVIKEWIEETPRWTKSRLVIDGGFDEVDKPVGYETQKLNNTDYVKVQGQEGSILAKIKITFVLKKININVV